MKVIDCVIMKKTHYFRIDDDRIYFIQISVSTIFFFFKSLTRPLVSGVDDESLVLTEAVIQKRVCVEFWN